MENIFIFMHSEWADLCILDNNTIQRKNIDNEKGTYHILNNEFIINWDKWEGDDIFILFNDCYYHKIFYNKYILNKILISNTIYYDNCNYDLYINLDNNYLFKKFDIINIANYSKNNNILTIKWNESIEETFININEKFYNNKYIIKLLEIDNFNNNNIDNFLKINNFTISNNIFKESKKIEKFKKINNNLYFKSYNDSINLTLNNSDNSNKINNFNINDNFSNNFNYKLIDLEIDYNNLKEKVESLLFENKLTNKNYLNKNNINKYLNNISKNKDIFNDFFNLELNFEIPIKKNKRVLTLVEWAYPPFGGGENWILNFNKILYNNNYDNFIICFSDMFKNISFTETKLINLDYVKIIQMPKDLIYIIKMIKVINPDIINHQGIYREYFMKISNVLEIPFLTGFCFWQNIVKFNMDNINVNMINNNGLERTDEFENILNNSYTYSSSHFVNDIIEKLYNKKLDVIETISLKEDFYIGYENNQNKIYVTLINCHYNKGGYLLEELCNNLNINIPLQLVYTENDPIINIEFLTSLINKRNEKNNINKIIKEKVDVKIIYKKTKIIIIPSICDETFCRVGYEAMINKIPIISSSNGNLKYLLKDYALFIDNNDTQKWSNEIEKLYFNNKTINDFKSKNISTLNEVYIEKKILNKINNINESKYKLSDKNIGLIIPWADQGLGIQGREYYISIKNIGYNPYVLSFKPYHATHENIRLQTDETEWDYENISYSPNYREDLTYDEIIDFVYKYNIKKIIIIEATYIHIFRIAMFLKLLNVKIYLAINLECTRLEELDYHYIFDKIITNNLNSYLIMSNIFNDKIFNLGFHLSHNYFQNRNNKKKINEIKNKEKLKLKFFCTGGFNAISRKNIDLIVITFYNIFNDNIFLNWELNVYIQGVQIPEEINKYSCDNIKYHVNNLPYKLIIDKYFEHDIFIHMGSHEGLGIGFYESIYCGTPILTMDWIPNSEVIIDNQNGWLTNCSYSDIYDNDNSLLNKGIIIEKILKKKIIEIIEDKDNTINIINNSINNIDKISKINKSLFENNFLNFLSE
jgi:hypothetical protein